MLREKKILEMIKMASRYFTNVMFEAIFIGLLNLLFFSVVHKATGANVTTALVATGAMLHLSFEYSFGNVNEKWCRSTFKC